MTLIQRWLWMVILAVGGVSAAWADSSFAGGRAQLDLPRATLRAGRHQIYVQLAITPQQRQIGLMHRAEMPYNEGMLFVFEEAAVQCFWMRNTKLPLTAAFVADDGTIVNLADMQPMSDDQHCSAAPVRYVLEMNQGWFKSRGVRAGSKLRHPAFARFASRAKQP